MPFPFQSILRKAIPSKRGSGNTTPPEDATPETHAGEDAESSVNHDWRADLQAAAQTDETPQSEQFENIDLSGEPDASEPNRPKSGRRIIRIGGIAALAIGAIAIPVIALTILSGNDETPANLPDTTLPAAAPIAAEPETATPETEPENDEMADLMTLPTLPPLETLPERPTKVPTPTGGIIQPTEVPDTPEPTTAPTATVTVTTEPTPGDNGENSDATDNTPAPTFTPEPTPTPFHTPTPGLPPLPPADTNQFVIFTGKVTIGNRAAPAGTDVHLENRNYVPPYISKTKVDHRGNYRIAYDVLSVPEARFFVAQVATETVADPHACRQSSPAGICIADLRIDAISR